MRAQYDDAVGDARRAVKLAPGSTDVADLAGFVLARSGSPEEAAAQTKQSDGLSPNYPNARGYLLGVRFAVNVFIASIIVWITLRFFKHARPIWAIASMIASSKPVVKQGV